MFLVITRVSLSRPTQSLTVLVAADVAAAAVIVRHAVVAQHRVYGESWTKTTLKAVAVAVLYLVLWGITSVGAAMWAATT